MQDRSKQSRSKKILCGTVAVLFWIGVWWLISCIVDSALLLPSPPKVFLRLGQLSLSLAFWKSIGFTVLRIVAGILIATAVGYLLALLGIRFPFVQTLVKPIMVTVKATPVASFIILLLLWVGQDILPAVISALIVLPIIWENVSEGLQSTDRKLLEMAQVFSLSPFTVLRVLYIPAAHPYFLAGCRSAIGMGWKAGVAAEVLAVTADSIGKALFESKLYLETNDLFAWTICVILISVASEQLLLRTLFSVGLQKKAKEEEKDEKEGEAHD